MTLPRGFAGVSGVTVRLMSDGAGVTPAARARNRSAAQGRSGRQAVSVHRIDGAVVFRRSCYPAMEDAGGWAVDPGQMSIQIW